MKGSSSITSENHTVFRAYLCYESSNELQCSCVFNYTDDLLLMNS
jgi:hypothetical protein